MTHVTKNKFILLLSYAIAAVSIVLVTSFAFVLGGGGGSVSGAASELVFSSASAQKAYDGTPLTCDEWTLLSGSLKRGHTVQVAVVGQRTEVGTTPNTMAVKVLDANARDVTESYTIRLEPGNLTISVQRLEIHSQSASKVYDGLVLAMDGYMLAEGSVAEGHSLSVTVSGQRIEAGISNNLFAAVILDGEGTDVSSCYEIVKVYGKLEVTPRAISIVSLSYAAVYNGEPVTYPHWEYASDTRALDGHVLTVTISGSQTNVGTSKNYISDVFVTDGARDVTRNYTINRLEGDLIVTPRTITIRSDSDQKPYDGTPLTNANWACISLTQPVSHHEVMVHNSGSQTRVGSSDNTIAEVLILSDGTNVTFNYVIVREDGLLTVTEASGNPSGGEGEGEGEGGNSGGNIGLDGDIDDTGMGDFQSDTPLFLATGNFDGGIYFRIKSYGDYAGTRWQDAPAYSEGSVNALYLTYLALANGGKQVNTVAIEPLFDDLHYMLPSYAKGGYLTKDDTLFQGALSVPEMFSLISYTYNASDSFTLSGTGYEAFEQAYYNHVLATYLQLPENVKAQLLEIAAQNNLRADSPTVIADVGAFVQSKVRYDLDFEDYLGDIALYFFTQAQTGICQHYATAATAMLRALGIPARYTVGYVSQVQKNQPVEVTGKQAHAWVEVYIQGMGWVQIEVTGTDGDSNVPSGGGGESDDEAEYQMVIKPIDLSMAYTTGAVLYAKNELQGLASFLSQGYTYTALVSGTQSVVGISASTIDSFALFDPSGKDVTKDFKIKLDKGKLHMYIKEITLTTATLEKVYDGIEAHSPDGSYLIEGALMPGHHIERVESVLQQKNVGVYQNAYEVLVCDEAGNDVTFMYNVVKKFGTFTIHKREITITADSAEKEYDGTALATAGFTLDSPESVPLAEGQTIDVQIEGSQTNRGRSANVVKRVSIFDQEGFEVTSNYSVLIVNGWLRVR